jgi:hypothetical protein
MWILDKIDLVENQLEQIKSIAEYYSIHKRTPSDKTSELGRVLSRLKTSYNNPGKYSWVVYDDTVKYMKENGLLWLFENLDLESKQLGQVKSIVSFYQENNKTPDPKSTIVEERKLGIKLAEIRKSMVGKGHCVIYDKTREYLNSQDMLWIIKPRDNTSIQLNQIQNIINFHRHTNKTPSYSSKNDEEKKLGSVLSKLKMIHSGKCRGQIYPECLELLKENNYLWILEQRRL